MDAPCAVRGDTGTECCTLKACKNERTSFGAVGGAAVSHNALHTAAL